MDLQRIDGRTARFYTLVCDLQHQEGLTLLCASHDLDVVSAHADHVILLELQRRIQGRLPLPWLGEGSPDG